MKTIKETFIELTKDLGTIIDYKGSIGVIIKDIGKQQELFKELNERDLRTSWDNYEDQYIIFVRYPEDLGKPCKRTDKELLEESYKNIKEFGKYLSNKITISDITFIPTLQKFEKTFKEVL